MCIRDRSTGGTAASCMDKSKKADRSSERRSRSRSRSRDRRRDRDRRSSPDRQKKRSRSPEKAADPTPKTAPAVDEKAAKRAKRLALLKAAQLNGLAPKSDAPAPVVPVTMCAPCQPREMTSRDRRREEAQVAEDAQKAWAMIQAQKLAEQAMLNDNEPDPLDEYMAGSGIMDEAKKEKEAAEAKAAADIATLAAGEEIDEGDRAMTYEQSRMAQEAAGWHCYICKKYGHTKRDCPEREWDPTKVSARQAEDMGLEMCCKHCGESGHVIRDCPQKRIADKAQNRKKQYEKKKMIRAAERLALKAKVHHQLEQDSIKKKAEFDAMYASYGKLSDAPTEPVSVEEQAAIESEMAKEASEAQQGAAIALPPGDAVISLPPPGTQLAPTGETTPTVADGEVPAVD
eukprot:TRINITY_DN15694_c0_g1_i2.p1 TRINITY_DN15694_c0_g1~~TRINITY_DN15694_c0_g1_i2.p1  ORF type:complete len:401 (-),score=103.43 TRINITY_DN15694_c0_g1_i2:31-1233(-)